MREEETLLFRHVSADRGVLYRQILDVFASARRQFRLQLRPDDVLAEGTSGSPPPSLEDLNQALTQLTAWGNLETQADMSRASSLSMFYRARLLYRLSLRTGRVVSAILPPLSQLSAHSPKVFAAARRCFSRCFSTAGDLPSRTARRASSSFSRANASEMPPRP